jgi:mRNA interferase RelE/StbE
MNPFTVVLTPEAQSDILRLDPAIQTRILNRLDWMGENAELLRHQVLQGDEWRGCFRYRLGVYRIIYQLDQSAKRLTILKVGHRREVYK